MTQVERENPDILALRSTRIFSIFVVFVSAVSAASWHYIGGVQEWEWILSTLWSLAALGMTFLFPRMRKAYSTSLLFVAINLGLFATAISQIQLAESGLTWQPFGGFKLAALAVALFLPYPMWIIYWTILASGILPVAMYFTVLADYRANLSVQEPWTTVVYAVVAYGILRYRIRSQELERELARVSAEKEVLSETARVFLAIRDLTNTPLQAVGITAALLESKSLTQEEAVTHLNEALVQLHKLNEILSLYENEINWEKRNESFDAVTVLQERLTRFRRQTRRFEPGLT